MRQRARDLHPLHGPDRPLSLGQWNMDDPVARGSGGDRSRSLPPAGDQNVVLGSNELAVLFALDRFLGRGRLQRIRTEISAPSTEEPPFRRGE
jgi:hypothetical protein